MKCPCVYLYAVSVLAQTPVDLPPVRPGVQFHYAMKASASDALFEVAPGEPLPPGLALDPHTGVISGAVAKPQAEPYRFSVAVRDSYGQTLTLRFSLPVTPPPLTVTLPGGRVAAATVTAVVGFEQAGASAASGTQRFFLDLSAHRPLPMNPRWRWWGDVRILSVPQQVDAPVVQLGSALANRAAALKINELAEAGEFVTGIEYLLAFAHSTELTAFVGAGAIGVLDPKRTLAIYQTPAPGSAQYSRFIREFPEAAGKLYVGFLPPDRDRFYRQYVGGLRLTSAKGGAVAVSLGQNELISGGRLAGITGRIDASYRFRPSDSGNPLAGVYLFGSAVLQLSGAQAHNPFVLQPAGNDISGYHPGVALIPVAGSRDLYRIGIGLDLISALNSRKRTQPAGGK